MALDWTPRKSRILSPSDIRANKASNVADSAKYASSRNWIISGLDLSAGTGLNVAVSAGYGWIDGYVISETGQEVAVAPSTTNYVFIEISKDLNGEVVSVDYEVNTTGTPPSDGHIVLGEVTTDGSGVTAVTEVGRSPETQVEASANAWGDIGGDLEDQTDLQSALDAKANASALGDLAGLDTVDTPQIEDDAVTFAKTQNIATSRILGRTTAGTGNIEELTAAQVLSLIGISMPVGNGKTSSQTFNSTTWTDVTGLSVTGLAANATYEITVKLIFQRMSGTDDLSVRSVVTGRSGTIYANYISTYQILTGSDVAHTQDFSYAADNGTAIPILQNSFGMVGYCQLTYRFTTGGSGGTFKIQAQMSAGSNSASIREGATIMAIRAS